MKETSSYAKLEVVALGAGCEVGRSCIVLTYNNRSIMFDCGIHPAHTGVGALPIFDATNVSKIDLCLVTHFHLDHCGALPYFASKTAFKGRIFMTEPTKAIAKFLWSDYAAMTKNNNTLNQTATKNQPSSVQTSSQFAAASIYQVSSNAATSEYMNSIETLLFDSDDINETFEKCEIINFGQTLKFNDSGITVTCLSAGHVLGACMFSVQIDGVRVLYTGDFSCEVDRHVPVADIPTFPIDVLICESTYGIRVHEPRDQREKRFLKSVDAIIARKGKCLMPVFALGRAQELMFILDEHWQANPQYQNIPVWFISPLNSICLSIFKTYISMAGDYVKQLADSGEAPFHFKHIKTAGRIDEVRDVIHKPGPCVILAAPGMLQSGTSRYLFEAWCRDKKNGIILTGYTLKRTLADDLKKNKQSIQLKPNGPEVPINCSFEMISFSAHSDFNQTYNFINSVKAGIVVLVHGERGEVTHLRDKLKELRPNIAVFTPEILQRLELWFRIRNVAHALGDACDVPPKDSHMVAIINSMNLPRILPFKNLSLHYPTAKFIQCISIEYSKEFLSHLINRLRFLYENINQVTENFVTVENYVDIHLVKENLLTVTWDNNPVTQMIADSILNLCIDSNSSLLSLKPDSEDTVFCYIKKILTDMYKDVKVHENNVLQLNVPKANQNNVYNPVFVHFAERMINCEDDQTAQTIRLLLRRIESAIYPSRSLKCLSE